MGRLIVLAELRDNSDLRQFNELITSWPFQLALLLLVAGLVALAFFRPPGEYDSGAQHRRFQLAVVVLGVLVGLQFLLDGILSFVIWPTWLGIVETLYLFALLIYAIIRFMTRQRSGPADEEAQRRGRQLQASLDGMERELPVQSPKAAD